MVHRLLTIAAIGLSLCCSASAAIQNPGVVQVGTIVAGHCAYWVADHKIADAGAC